MAEEAAEAEEAPKPPKGKLFLMLGLVAGLLLGGGGTAGYFLFLAPATPEGEGVLALENAPLKPINVQFFVLDRLSAPLIDQNRKIVGYVGLDLALEVDGEAYVKYLEDREPILRHAANVTLSKAGAGLPDRTRQVDYERIAEELKTAFNASLDQPVVLAVRVSQAVRL
ncbi:MAG: hypothetical protein ACOY99_06745 [Pseudomonadota bacterium]